jgi:hypothetical protein
MPGFGWAAGDLRERALRAEAQADAARAEDHTNEMCAQARIRELERELAEMTGSLSWRLTAPLRRGRRGR